MVPHTYIRMGASHYDVYSTLGEHTGSADLAKVVWGLNRQERNARLAGIANQLCGLHDIGTAHTPPKRTKRKHHHPAPALAPMEM